MVRVPTYVRGRREGRRFRSVSFILYSIVARRGVSIGPSAVCVVSRVWPSPIARG
jgi:hypothetical protein